MCTSLVQMESRISESKSHKGEISDMREISREQVCITRKKWFTGRKGMGN